LAGEGSQEEEAEEAETQEGIHGEWGKNIAENIGLGPLIELLLGYSNLYSRFN
jgi:hypothetical protein